MKRWGRTITLWMSGFMIGSALFGLVGSLRSQSPAPAGKNILTLHGACVIADPTLNTVAITTHAPVPCRAIVYNPNIMAQIPEATVLLIFMHEYAHLILNHTTPPAALTIDQMRALERDADCEGAKIFMRHWPDKLDEALQVAAQLMDMSPSITHDGSVERVQLIRKCARGEL